MNIQRTLVALLAITICLITVTTDASAQSAEAYQQMTQPQRAAFVAEQARRIGRQMSGRDYQFTPAFEAEIQKFVDSYVRRIDKPGKSDARLIFERGQTVASTLSGIFKAREVSPLMGIYVPLIESEYINLQEPN